MRNAASLNIDDYKAVLFDMNGTFMFDGDRFGPQQNYYASYLSVGGGKLTRSEVQSAVNACYSAFQRDYEDPRLTECFPSLNEFIAMYTDIPFSEREAIAKTIAKHEVGRVPVWAARSIRFVAERCTVALVSNVWAPSFHWDSELMASGVAPLLTAAVFSTDLKAIKPSEKPFHAALEAIGLSPWEAIYVGDSPNRDILPARSLGMSTCLVGGSKHCSAADFHVQTISELAK